MKKAVLILLACVMAFAVLFAVGCKDNKGGTTTPPGGTTDVGDNTGGNTGDNTGGNSGENQGGGTETKTVYEILDGLAAKKPAGATLGVTTVTGGETLTGSYTFAAAESGYTVTYSYEKLNTVEVSDGGITVPTEAKSTVSGTTTAETLGLNLSFAQANFTDFTDSDGSVTAGVSNPAAFMKDREFTCTDMTLSLTYTDSAITAITVSYSTADSQVTLAYTFSY